VDAGNGNIALVALANSEYVCADNGGANPLIANRHAFGAWETYTELDAGGGHTALRALANNQIVCADSGGASPLIANRTSAGSWESFTVGAGNATGDAIFFQNTGYGGAQGYPLPVGTYTLSQLASRGVPNDWANSVRIAGGRTVIFYADDNFSGTSWTLTSDTSNFSQLNPNAANQMSSCKVQ
jgi:hypothetical protein